MLHATVPDNYVCVPADAFWFVIFALVLGAVLEIVRAWEHRNGSSIKLRRNRRNWEDK